MMGARRSTPRQSSAFDILMVAGLLAAVPVVFWRATANPFQQPKATLFVLVAVLLSLGYLQRALRSATAVRARSSFVWLLVALIVAGAAATLASDATRLSFWGDQAHATGLLLYLAAGVTAVTTLHSASSSAIAIWLRAISVGTGVAALYAVVQAIGGDPFSWTGSRSGSASTLGQANFAAGYLGATAPALLGYALFGGDRSRVWRLGVGTVGATAVAATLVTASFQGPVTLVSGSVFIGLVFGTRRLRAAGAASKKTAGTLAGAMAVLVAVGAWQARTRLLSEVEAGLLERRLFWRAARDVIADYPALGTGLDTFALYFNAYRPAEHGAWLGFTNAEAPHSVPLAMFTSGGLLLGLAYVVLVVFTGWRLVLGLRRLQGHDRILLTLVGSIWVGYQVQSLVSIDVPPLILLHFWSAAVVVWLAERPVSVVYRLPWSDAKWLRRRQSAAQSAVSVGIAVVATLAGFVLSGPLRADAYAASGFEAAERGATQEANARLKRATEIAPYRAFYWYLQARFLATVGEESSARDAAQTAARRDFGSSQAALLAGRLAAAAGDAGDAIRWYTVAVRRDPQNPEVLRRVIPFLRDHGKAPLADDYEERLDRLDAIETPW